MATITNSLLLRNYLIGKLHNNSLRGIKTSWLLPCPWLMPGLSNLWGAVDVTEAEQLWLY